MRANHIIAILEMDASTDGNVSAHLTPPGQLDSPGKVARPTDVMERVSNVLGTSAGPLNAGDMRTAVGGQGIDRRQCAPVFAGRAPRRRQQNRAYHSPSLGSALSRWYP
ncbi:MAG: hypothetical protein ACLQVK_22275 [Acidimicrobiales bacterium]